MHDTRADFTNTFRQLSTAGAAPAPAAAAAAFEAWRTEWQARLARQAQAPGDVAALMQRHNPAMIPRNHKVEEALAAATGGDVGPLERLMAALAAPYDHVRVGPEFSSPPEPDGPPYRTFCGT
jgi:uncharacterized protein YdiU (UPF0061 family)